MINYYDLETDKTNKRGEELRDLVFKQYNAKGKYIGRGCYEVFDLKDGFQQIPSTNFPLMSFIVSYSNEDIPNAYESDDIIVMWLWDGDGTLAIHQKGDDFVYVNTDCKKDYVWQKLSFEELIKERLEYLRRYKTIK